MQVEHPLAGDGDGVPPGKVDVNGEAISVDEEGVFELPDDQSGWLQRFADAYDVDPETLIPSDDAVEPPFDPSEFNVDELEERLEGADLTVDELDALADAEADGKNRETALDAISDAKEE
ncbi:hypothetical protein [Halorussus sp. AFM4]|uniref:hypothetical protein n=1 Tax=Halorussus sp. AFM4 TaxID=3421651 RepID=UPI003EBBBE2C